MFASFRKRSNELEHLDTGDYSPEEYEGCMVELQRVNRWLGDAKALRLSLLADIERTGLRSFSVLDVAAGSGELLRVAAEWARAHRLAGRFTAVELNARSASAVLENSTERPEIVSVRADALRLPFADGSFDYSICSLFVHHLADADVVQALGEMERVARRRLFVIDLHRNPIAYYFYRTVGRLFLHNRLIREDGALSILRSFKPQELISLASRAGLDDVSIERRFPYRLVLNARAKWNGPDCPSHSGKAEPATTDMAAGYIGQADSLNLAQ
jgi:ubiquinone/menaquinone biosynthesis C-methylase UbiE